MSVRDRRARPRIESWKPDISSLTVVGSLPPWSRRRQLLDPLAVDDMCDLNELNKGGATGPSLGLVPVSEVQSLRISAHPGWSQAEQAKIDNYVRQDGLFDPADKSPLEPPRFRGHYVWRCFNQTCRGHRAVHHRLGVRGAAEAPSGTTRG